jgi:hypothetical protein
MVFSAVFTVFKSEALIVANLAKSASMTLTVERASTATLWQYAAMSDGKE